MVGAVPVLRVRIEHLCAAGAENPVRVVRIVAALHSALVPVSSGSRDVTTTSNYDRNPMTKSYKCRFREEYLPQLFSLGPTAVDHGLTACAQACHLLSCVPDGDIEGFAFHLVSGVPKRFGRIRWRGSAGRRNQSVLERWIEEARSSQPINLFKKAHDEFLTAHSGKPSTLGGMDDMLNEVTAHASRSFTGNVLFEIEPGPAIRLAATEEFVR